MKRSGVSGLVESYRDRVLRGARRGRFEQARLREHVPFLDESSSTRVRR
jgi:hypothetical protein